MGEEGKEKVSIQRPTKSSATADSSKGEGEEEGCNVIAPMIFFLC